ncbi:leucine-rich repeat serine/threonine-protein kinase 2-like isoform X2 [Mizuhopecten yessoensis]|uniref:leucine-rich repeat serine/threonine-protein kinase 2-like isoform X2 n=1 Tax=Mizuhopecten yessoensis TaxID=6573 RepID=UPI000B45C076|nr:leucine-rich repeat serine/threonine-protein kinase 2-like isoform X2 [Mizuhopecten yessoensis]
MHVLARHKTRIYTGNNVVMYTTLELDTLNRNVDDSRYLDTENQIPLDNMPPQNNLTISNDVRRLSISDLISAMKSEPANCQSQIKACLDMERFADDDDIEVLMKKQEAISAMVAAMATFMDNTELHLAACKTLVALSTNSEASCIQVCRENGIAILLQVIRNHGDHIPLLLSVLEILGNVSLTEELSEEIVKNAGHSEILATMSRQRDDYKVAKLCCFILGNLVNTVDVAQSIMFVGGVHAIIGALQSFPTNAEVLENGCRALGCFSAHDEICMDVVNAGAVEAVLVAMAVVPDVDTLQECGCWALACLTKFEESCVNICNNNGINTIVTTLEKFPKDEALQEYGWWTISNLSAHETTLSHVVNHRLLGVSMDAMCQFPDNLEIQHQIFFAIGQIVMTSGEMQEKLVKKGGVRSAVNIMTCFPDSQELQEHGCRILGNVAVNEQLRKLIEADGGSKAVIAAMLTHDRHEQIQTYGCMALTNITADVPENKGRVAANSGVSAVLATIKEMTSNSDVVLCGLKTLCNLMGGEDASYYFMEDEGLETMEMIIYRYIKCPNIQHYICRILASVPLAPGLDDTCLDATEDILYDAVNRFHGDSDLHLSTCHYYENLVLTETGRSRFNKGKYLDRLADSMTFFKDDKSVQMSGCKTIAAISMYKNGSIQKEELCVSLVLDVMKIFHACSSVQTVCCGAISYLAEHNENLRDYILRKGGLDVMMANLHEHPEDEGLAVVGLMALDSITHTGITDSNRLQKEIEFVSRMMKRYPDSLELQIYGCNILSAVGKEGISWCDCTRSEALEPVTCILKRRRSNPELESTALEVLTLLLCGEREDIIRNTRDKLPFLDDDFWEKCYRNVLHID